MARAVNKLWESLLKSVWEKLWESFHMVAGVEVLHIFWQKFTQKVAVCGKICGYFSTQNSPSYSNRFAQFPHSLLLQLLNI